MNKYLIERIENLLLDEHIKRFLLGRNGEFLSKHDFYVNLIEYYNPVFTDIKKENLEDLRLSSYLYFRALLLADGMFDNPKDKREKLKLFIPIFEEAVKSLAWIFPRDSSFWFGFNYNKTRYFNIWASLKTHVKSTKIG